MNKRIKIVILAIFLIISISFSGFAQAPEGLPLSGLKQQTEKFSEELARTLPFNASLGLNWSSAYVGKFFPNVPPHFGAGVSFGITTFELSAMSGLAQISPVSGSVQCNSPVAASKQ